MTTLVHHFARIVLGVLLISLGTSLAVLADLSEERLDAIRLQIFLDEANYGPGVIDGKIGWVTQMAEELWKENNPEFADDPEKFAAEIKRVVPDVVVTAIVPQKVENYVDSKLSDKREEQAKRKDMPYRSVLEFMAERYHTTEDTLFELNSRKKIRHAKAGSDLLVPAVTPFEIENVKPFSYKKDDVLTKRRGVIDTEKKRLYIYEEVEPETENPLIVFTLKLIATFPITPGKPQFIRRGEWVMKTSITWPDWRFDKQLLETGERSNKFLTIPGGPNNPVGMLWAGLSYPGIGMHGTSSPRTIGRSQSAGCIRLTNWDILRVPNHIRPGAAVVIK